MSIEEQLNEIRSNIFNIRLKNNLSDSILNYFTMSIGLFFYGSIYAKIIVKDNTKPFFYELIMFSGILQIILGIFDWYKKKDKNSINKYFIRNFVYFMVL